MPRLKKSSPKIPSLKDRIAQLEKSLADIQKQFSAEHIISSVKDMMKEINQPPQPMDITLDILEQANGQNIDKSSPLDSLEITNGELKTDPLDKVRNLEKALCMAKTNPFGTTDFSIFEQNLEGMTMASLQSLAQGVGVDPYTSYPVLKGALKTAFIHTTKGSLKERPKPVQKTLDPRNPEHLKVMQSLGMKV